jgi:hypothetical protein
VFYHYQCLSSLPLFKVPADNSIVKGVWLKESSENGNCEYGATRICIKQSMPESYVVPQE